MGNEEKDDVREVKIKSYKEGMYLPPENYYACEVLPEDWEDIIPTFNLRASMVTTNYNRSPSPGNKSHFFILYSPIKEPLYLRYNKSTKEREESSSK